MKQTDTEILKWLLGKLERGLLANAKHGFFLDGKPFAGDPREVFGWQKFKELKKDGSLVVKRTGYRLYSNLVVEESEKVGEGATIREAILEAMRKEMAGAPCTGCGSTSG